MKFVLAFLCLGIFFSAQAQSALDYVPENAVAVFRINPSKINQKMDIAEIQQLEMFDMVLEQITGSLPPEQQADAYKMLTSPSQYGMDLMQPYCFFAAPGGESLNLFGMVMALSDANTFGTTMQKQLAGMAPEDALEKVDGFNRFSLGNDMFLCWNEQVALIASGQVQIDYSNYWNLTEEELAEQENAQAGLITAGVSDLMGKGLGKSIAKNNRYQQSTAGSSDMHFWLDYESISEWTNSLAGGMADLGTLGMGSYMEMMKGYYKDMDLDMGIEFIEGAMKMSVNLFADDQLLSIYEEGYDEKLNKDFIKYIDAESTLGYVFFNMDLDDVMEGTYEYLKPLIREVPEYGEIGIAALEVLDVAVDEDALFDLIEGDMLLTFNGIKEVTEEVTTIEYDDDFNPTEVTKTVTNSIPQISFFMGYENGEGWEKIMNLGMLFGVVEKSGSMYSFSDIPDLEDLTLHMRMQDGIMVMSNDMDFVQNKAASGYSATISKDEQKKLKKNAQVMRMDFSKLLEMGMAMSGGEGEMDEIAKIFEEVGFTTMEVLTSKKIDGKVQTEMFLNLKDQETNALRSFLMLMNKAFLEEMGGARM